MEEEVVPYTGVLINGNVETVSYVLPHGVRGDQPLVYLLITLLEVPVILAIDTTNLSIKYITEEVV